jgi:hypothetical protein
MAHAMIPVACVAVLVSMLPTVQRLAAGKPGGSGAAKPSVTRSVSGSAVHFFTTAMIHSQEPTAVGMIQRSTDIVELSGDLKGRVLYHPASVFDFVNGTLVNTGHQVFSGTVLGSAPVLLHDDQFRFDVNLNGGVEAGEVHLKNHLAGPKIACDLIVSGAGTKTPEGNALVDYTGTCTFKS